jgi:hypothetical protein
MTKLLSILTMVAIVTFSLVNAQAGNYGASDQALHESSVVFSSSSALTRPPQFNPPSHGGKVRINPPSRR